MFYDYHTHCNMSNDSVTPPEDMLRAAMARGVKQICMTDHMDVDFPFGEPTPSLVPEEYRKAQLEIISRMAGAGIEIRRGIEVGVQPQAMDYIKGLMAGHDFDFIIASLHLVKGQDAYLPEYFDGRDLIGCFREYIIELIECLSVYEDYSIVGHIGYPSRMAPYPNSFMRYKDMADEADVLLKLVAESGHGIEVNTSAYNKLGEPVPGFDFVKRFKELGGEIVTIGSDAHNPNAVAQHFERAMCGVMGAGFEYIAAFKGMKPEFVRIEDCLLDRRAG